MCASKKFLHKKKQDSEGIRSKVPQDDQHGVTIRGAKRKGIDRMATM